MSNPSKPRRAAPLQPDAVSVPIGPRVFDLLDLAYRARRPLLLEGPTGVGKSQIVAQFARSAGIQMVVLDLSLLEPPDLIGLPIIEQGRTHYASPAELPSSGAGILMLEELNRAEIPVMQPALQLLSARRLHSYTLPEGWSCVAAVNPENGDYQVNQLDPALRSRFMQLHVCAARESWLEWARDANVHPAVLGIVAAYADAFESASPRSWTYASELLHTLRPDEFANTDLVRVALRGYLPTSWSHALVEALQSAPSGPLMNMEELLNAGGAGAMKRRVAEYEALGRPDAVAMLSSRLRHSLAQPAVAAEIEAKGLGMDWLEELAQPLPGDYRDQVLDAAARSPAAKTLLASLQIDLPLILRGGVPPAVIQEWRDTMRLHRVRALITMACDHLDDRVGDVTPSALLALNKLAKETGVLGAELERRLKSRDA